jgi:soluble P-type ATPase
MKSGIRIEIPGFGHLQIHAICSDYTGTLSCEGELIKGVRKRLRQLAKLVDIHVVTSDTCKTARK